MPGAELNVVVLSPDRVWCRALTDPVDPGVDRLPSLWRTTRPMTVRFGDDGVDLLESSASVRSRSPRTPDG